MVQISRNTPCPCGSGKKYKRCCMGKETESQQPVHETILGLRGYLEGQEFKSLNEAQHFVNTYSQSRNARPIKEFHDISPEQMMRLLHFPFDSPEIIQFESPKSDVSTAPLFKLLRLLIAGISESGAKATAKGNLPRNLCPLLFAKGYLC